MNRKTLATTLIAIIVILASATIYFSTTKNAPTSSPAPQNTESQIADNDVPAQSKEIVSCGKNYTADIVTIGEVDVVKKIIEQKSSEGCEFFGIAGNNIAVAQKAGATQKVYLVVLYDKNDKRQSADPFNQSHEIYRIDLNKNELFYQSQFDGSFYKLGDWK